MTDRTDVAALESRDGATTAAVPDPAANAAARERARERVGLRLGSRGWAYGSLAVAVLGVMLAFSPGLISYDTNGVLWEAQTGFVRDWWTPFGSLLLGTANDLEIGLGPVFLAQTTLVVSGLYLCLRLLLRRVPAALGSAAICAFPPMYGQLANLSRDSMYLGFTLLAFGFLSRATVSAGRLRGFAVTLALLSAIAAFLWRQNGIVTLFAISASVVFLASTDASWRPQLLRRFRVPRASPRTCLVAGAAGCLIAGLVLGATQWTYRLLDVVPTHPERSLFVFDMAGVSTATNRNVFPGDLPRRVPGRLGVTPPDISLRALERNFDHSNVITLYAPNGDWTSGLNRPAVAEREASILKDGWWDAVSEQPGAYAANRLKLVGSQLGFGRLPTDAYYGLLEPTNFNHPMAFWQGYNAASDYVKTFSGPGATVRLDLIWPYMVMATFGLAFLWRRVEAATRVPLLVMVATPWLALAVLAAVSIAAGFRYMVLAVPVALMTAIFAAAVAGARNRWGQAILRPRLS
jgi:hypothetical protein